MDAKAGLAIIGAIVVIVFTAFVATYSRPALGYALVCFISLYFLVGWRLFFGDSHWPMASTILVVITAVSISVGAWRLWALPTFWPLAPPLWETGKVTVAPTAPFQLRSGRWQGAQAVTIKNIDPGSSYYSVWVEVRCSPIGAPATGLMINGKIDQNAPRIHGMLAHSPSVDGWGFIGTLESGHGAVLISLYRIGPLEERVIHVSSSTQIDSTAVVTVLGYRRAPPQAIKDGIEEGVTFQLPKGLTATGYYHMRDT